MDCHWKPKANLNLLGMLGNRVQPFCRKKPRFLESGLFLFPALVLFRFFGFFKVPLYLLEFGGFLMYSSASLRPVSLTNWMSSSGVPTAGE